MKREDEAMDTDRIEKIAAEIQRLRDKVAEYNKRITELTKKKTELENTMILSRIRALNLTPEELRIFLESGALPDNNDSHESM